MGWGWEVVEQSTSCYGEAVKLQFFLKNVNKGVKVTALPQSVTKLCRFHKHLLAETSIDR